MHPLSDPHDPKHELDRLDGIVLAALGEPVDPAVRAHQDSCPQCSRQRAELQHTVGLAREPVEALTTPEVQPPSSVWAGIAAELGIDDGSIRPSAPARLSSAPPARSATTPPGPTSRRFRRGARPLLVAAATVGLIAASAVGYAVGRHTGATVTASCLTARATLQQMPGGPVQVDGEAVVVCSPNGPALQVKTTKLPLQQGFYEVWLYAPRSNRMVAVGTLGADGTGEFTLPAGVDLNDFHVVDVSAQRYNGNPAHDQSVLQGALTS